MRRRAWLAWGCLALGILLGLLGRVLPGASTWNLLSGLLVLAALGLGLSLLGLGRRFLPALQPMPDLFEVPGARDRWCTACGHVTPQAGPCRHCGEVPTPVSAGKPRPLQRKSGPRS